ncbi:MAG: hypothetical protein SD837_17875 [Candidatus Electrothrix scaldis]|nr:MAG: hypothetical protein SD837_17875 [Candidatus Electrothrix sp. GW3-3]
MYEQVEKPKENKSRAVANSVAQKKSHVKQGFGFVDNRPETVAQRKIQVLAGENFVRQRQRLQQKGDNNICQMMVRIENAPGPQKEFSYRDVLSYLQTHHPAIVNHVNLAELQNIDLSNPIFSDWNALIRRISTQEYTHHNLTRISRRRSVAEANILDRIIPAGAPIAAAGLTQAQFQARFQPLVAGGTISTAQLSALLPPQHAQAFPPARGGGANEIRAGRKWVIPNAVEGGVHEIWVHTNDPLRPNTENAGSGPIVRVKDSTGKFLSDVALNAPQNLLDQQAAATKKGKVNQQVNSAIADKTGQWTKPADDRGNNQHIPLV